MLEKQLTKQSEAFEKFKILKVGALFMKMGTGKTKVAINLIDYNNCDLLLYICPCNCIENIKHEFVKWNLKTPYEIVGYESIQSSDRIYLKTLKLLDNKKCFIVADESIFIKNESTKRFQRLVQLRKKCEYALILNGTPITKNEWDLYNQMEFLSPLILNMSRVQFLNTFFKKIIYKKKHERENVFYEFSKINSEYLYKLIEPYIFNAELYFTKQIYNKTDFIVDHDTKYNEFKDKSLEKINLCSSSAIIRMLNILNIIASNSTKKLDKIVEKYNNRQVIIVCNYLDEVNYLSSKMDCFTLTGSTKKKNREKIKELFYQNSLPLIMTYGIGSYSLNMQFCDTIVFSSINFDFGKMEQVKYRIQRIGQQNNINYHYILSDYPINKFILDNLDKKKSLKELIENKIQTGEIEKWVKYI